MTSKKSEAKRLVIFLLLAFALDWIPMIIFNTIFGYEQWFESDHFPIFAALVGYGPALANIITRKITKEGWHNSLLHIRLKGNIRYYVAALVIPGLYGLISGILITSLYGNWDFSQIVSRLSLKSDLGSILLIYSGGPLFVYSTFGEEFGWRGYMNQKMEPLLGTAGTCIAGGVIWGIWHAPLTIQGHNFGSDYPGYPYLGIILMCLHCLSEGTILMWLTKKTGSVYPAALLHAMNNCGGALTSDLLTTGVPDNFLSQMSLVKQFSVQTAGEALIAMICLILMITDGKKKKECINSAAVSGQA
ncbi:MAG: type II CAAX endopeptidase family protein [Oscillospiraceae bacterium]|nr:type II CAAX endopeptidase family protein [Oscillospiraceae bacterium]